MKKTLFLKASGHTTRGRHPVVRALFRRNDQCPVIRAWRHEADKRLDDARRLMDRRDRRVKQVHTNN